MCDLRCAAVGRGRGDQVTSVSCRRSFPRREAKATCSSGVNWRLSPPTPFTGVEGACAPERAPIGPRRSLRHGPVRQWQASLLMLFEKFKASETPRDRMIYLPRNNETTPRECIG